MIGYKNNYKFMAWMLMPATGIAMLICYHLIYSQFFPAENNLTGHDYSYFLPHLLDGYYWYLNNGAFAPPWFTPAFCGGLPALPNPQNIYFSVPQWITFFTDPLTAVYSTQLIFAAMGYTGFYLLLRTGFKASIGASVLGATLFLFNGFFANRMLIGHLTMHGFMLIPLISFLLLPGIKTLSLSKTQLVIHRLFPVSVSALLLSYLIYSGTITLILPILLTLGFIGILHGLLYGTKPDYWINLAVAGVVAIIISLPKLGPALAFLSHFSRDSYLLPGVDSMWNLLVFTFESLFIGPPTDRVTEVIANRQWSIQRHELEFGITFIPLVLLSLGAIAAGKQLLADRKSFSTRQGIEATGLLIILLVPLALNYYQPTWNAFLKEVPILKSSSLLFRWFSMYIPIIILISVIAFDRIRFSGRFHSYIGYLMAAGVVVICVNTDRSYYANQRYNPSVITDAYRQFHQSRSPPVITAGFVYLNQERKIYLPIDRDDVLVNGHSQLLCYEPIFGYRIERLPLGSIRSGPVNRVVNGVFNIKNPACYVYPQLNNCKPGDHFKEAQQQEVDAFTHYKPFHFAMPDWQKLANYASLAALIVILVILLAYSISALLRIRPASEKH